MEHSTLKMHATMLGSRPSIRYIKPQSLAVIEQVESLRRQGVQCYQTMDAGPNVKILCLPKDTDKIASLIQPLTQKLYILKVGKDARLI